jgi:hypothetical protein
MERPIVIVARNVAIQNITMELHHYHENAVNATIEKVQLPAPYSLV